MMFKLFSSYLLSMAVGLIVLAPADAFPAAQVRLQNFGAILRAEGVTKVVKLDSGQSILVTINRRNSWQPSLVEAGSDKSSENLMMIGACADSMDYCDTVYRFSWQYEYMNTGFTAPEVVTLETVSVSSKTAGRGCWISVNGTATYLDVRCLGFDAGACRRSPGPFVQSDCGGETVFDEFPVINSSEEGSAVRSPKRE
jgi:hypothetical protein